MAEKCPACLAGGTERTLVVVVVRFARPSFQVVPPLASVEPNGAFDPSKPHAKLPRLRLDPLLRANDMTRTKANIKARFLAVHLLKLRNPHLRASKLSQDRSWIPVNHHHIHPRPSKKSVAASLLQLVQHQVHHQTGLTTLSVIEQLGRFHAMESTRRSAVHQDILGLETACEVSTLMPTSGFQCGRVLLDALCTSAVSTIV